MLAALLGVLFAAPPQVAVTPFRVTGLPEARGELFAEHLATRLLERGIRVSTPRDVASVLGMERQRQLLGCDATSCLAEMASALGVKKLVIGEVARLDDGLQVMIKLLDTDTAQARYAHSAHVASEAAVLTTLDEWANQMSSQPGRNLVPLVPVGAGLVSASVGVGFLIRSANALAALQLRGDLALPFADAAVARSEGARDQLLGAVLTGVGGAAALAGLLWFALGGRDATPSVLLVPTPGGVVVLGVWP